MPVEFFEDPESERGSREEKANIEAIKKRIAIGILNRDITDDNPSDENGYTGLEQIIIYEFPENGEMYLEELKEDIIAKAQEIEDDEEIEDGYPFLGSDGEKTVIVKLTKSFLEGTLTDDAISPWCGFTGLEQAIVYEFGPVPEDVILEIRKKMYSSQLVMRGGCAFRNYKDLDDFVSEEFI